GPAVRRSRARAARVPRHGRPGPPERVHSREAHALASLSPTAHVPCPAWVRASRRTGRQTGKVTEPSLSERPAMPPPGASSPELLVAKLRGSARHLFWSALLLVAVAGATGYFYDNLPAPFGNGVLFAAAGILVILGVLWPWLSWLSRTYTITTRRVIARRGMFGRHRAELSHRRGYTISMRRSLFQRMGRTGTLELAGGVSDPLRLENIPDVALVHETLADQVE